MKNNFIISIKWIFLLGFGFFAPISLPAGGYLDITKNEPIFSNNSDTFVSSNNLYLRGSPVFGSPILRKIKRGTPLSILRYWQSDDGKSWMQVKIKSGIFINSYTCAYRGWIDV
tara:strand:- start:247 stop:588 length:342 start_codon:yes stop_codon:yes gene_type:complete